MEKPRTDGYSGLQPRGEIRPRNTDVRVVSRGQLKQRALCLHVSMQLKREDNRTHTLSGSGLQ